ncbi:amidohydrolase [Streptomyces sp. HNM0574]|uniref:amidohydrolase n=1 Tax=Streptomyces sp. HNM0574 TaxID=2714954 RepID=UPI00146AC00A|nr:amidohydrolase [Streptomyces sp. HNM0574]NLU70485.1 amidohydrolase [Streptomyces sp. HNM0574]
MDAAFSRAEALALRGGRVLAAGSEAEIRALTGPRTTTVDLAGRTALPGINDSHLHAAAFGASRPPHSLDCGSAAVSSLAGLAEAVRERAAALRPGTWLTGSGWDPGYLAECRADPRRHPTAADLDAASPSHPVALTDFSGHNVLLNSRAMERAGITRHTPVPPGGVIERHPDGTPTGLLRESAKDLGYAAVPAMTGEQRESAIRTAVRLCHAEGITSLTEPGLGPGGTSLFLGAAHTDTLRAYARLAAAGELGVRVSVLLLPLEMGGAASGLPERLAELEGICADADPRLLNVLGVKLFADGIPPARTAWMHEPYEESAGGGRGGLCLHGHSHAQQVGELREIVRYAHAAGHQLGVHITGDAGIDAVVDAFTEAQLEHPRPDARHYLIHGDFASPRALRTLAAHGWGANMNPGVKDTVADLMVGVAGPERAAYQWPVRDAVAAGIAVTASSDAPVTHPDWRRGVASMMLRESRASGRVSGPEQRVGLETALRAYTTHAARQDFAETWKGTLTSGAAADVCVVDGDLPHAGPHEIAELPVALTVFDGEIVHDAR